MALLPQSFPLPASLGAWFRLTQDEPSETSIGAAGLEPLLVKGDQALLKLEVLDEDDAEADGADRNHLGWVYLDPYGRDVYLTPWAYTSDNESPPSFADCIEAHTIAGRKHVEAERALSDIEVLKSQVLLWKVLCGFAVAAWFLLIK